MIQKIILIGLLLVASGCSNYKMIRKSDFVVPESTMRSCENLQLADDSTDEALLRHSGSIIKSYINCKSANEEKRKILIKIEDALK